MWTHLIRALYIVEPSNKSLYILSAFRSLIPAGLGSRFQQEEWKEHDKGKTTNAPGKEYNKDNGRGKGQEQGKGHETGRGSKPP